MPPRSQPLDEFVMREPTRNRDPDSHLSALATVLELLVGMGFEQREAQRMVDRVRDRLGDEPKVEEVLRAALRQAPTPGFTGVREERAIYRRLTPLAYGSVALSERTTT